MSSIRYERDDTGVVTLTLDDPAARANTMNQAFGGDLTAAVDRLYAERDDITGVVVTSAKSTFFAGGDLTLLSRVDDETLPGFAAYVESVKAALRRLETLGRPVVAALNGSALGGGLEIALACHHRIALADPKVRFGVPEVTLGLLPGAGGVVRITRLLGLQLGLTQVLLTGTRFNPTQARDLGLVNALADSTEEMLTAARAWIAEHPDAAQPWDVKGYKMPGGSPLQPAFAAMLPAFPATLRKQLKGAPMPAPHHILAAAIEGAALDIDSALLVEGRYFVDLCRGQTAKNMIQAFWFDLNAINGGASRPEGHDPRPATRVAVVGAGMMGAGIAYVTARAGIDVVLKDVSVEAAERGRAHCQGLLTKQVQRGKLDQAKAEQILARITPTADYADLAGCDLVVEAVFEKQSLKAEVFGELEPVVAGDALLGSNTSTLPITALAEAVGRPADFIGLHFFSPVDKMPLLEIIRGEQTSDAALARALDYAAQIRKTPIVVNDSRGFFTSRVIGTFVNEAVAMLTEGVPPSTIEQAALQAGYPVGPLQLSDELNLELMLKIRDETRAAAGAAYEPHPAEAVIEAMVADGRPGKLGGAGFYEYADGRRTGLWSGLAERYPAVADPMALDLGELGQRLLFIEAVESARCVEEGVLRSTPDANIGSIMGIGYPPWTGGVLQYINGFPGGVAGFVERADDFADRFGPRFAPNPLLRKMAEHDETF